MKKNTLLKLMSLVVVAGLAGCAKPKPSSSESKPDDPTTSEIKTSEQEQKTSSEQQTTSSEQKTSSEDKTSSSQQAHEHNFGAYTYDKGTHVRTCACGEEEREEHIFEKQPTCKDATCQEKGLLVEKCKICGYVKQEVTPKIDHIYAVDSEASTDATCTTAGKVVQKCTMCGDTNEIAVAALGHVWEADPTDPRNAEPTHLSDGIKVEKCTRCNDTQEVHTNPVPHTWALDGATSTTASGKTVTKWRCECNAVSYTMQAYDFDFLTSGSNAVADGYTAGTDAGNAGGIRIAGNGNMMWKMPVGAAGTYYFSACANYAPSSISGTEIQQKNAVTVNGAATELLVSGTYANIGLKNGSFTEIRMAKFEVTEEMANTELEIAITQKSQSRLYWGDYVRLTPAEPEAPHVHAFTYGDAVTAEGESTYRPGTCECGKKAIKISAGQDVNSVLSEGGKLGKGTSGSYDGTKIAKYSFTLSEAIKGHLQAVVSVDTAANCTEANGYSYYTGKSGGATQKVLQDGTTNTVMTVNGETITMPTTTYYEMGIKGTTVADAGVADYGSFDFGIGKNEFTLAATNSYGLQYYAFVIVQD